MWTKRISFIKNKSRKFGTIDPYYCHYLLLSQTVQMKTHEDDYFNLNVKPYYQQLIREAVPM